MNEKKNIYLIGCGPGRQTFLTAEAVRIIEECDCIIGAERIVEDVRRAGRDPQKMRQKPVYFSYLPREIHGFIREHPQYRKFAVVLSGDTGFFSGARQLLEELKEEAVEVLPGISSVSYLAARLGTTWQDAALVSLHGRQANYLQIIAEHSRTFLLLGAEGNGREICEKLARYGLEDLTFFIGRDLSYASEKILVRSGKEICPEDLEGLCTVMVENPHPRGRLTGSIADEKWIRGKIPMTKEEVRTVGIGKLRLHEHAVLYDIGAGTGSVAVTAALCSETIRVYAIEKDPQGIELIEKNKIRFCADGVTAVQGCAPDVLEGLESPTHVFIGGSSGKLKEIVRQVRRKNKEVRIVIHAVSLETLRTVAEAVEEGLLKSPEITQISVAKAQKLGMHHLMAGQNPVYIIADGGPEDLTLEKR